MLTLDNVTAGYGGGDVLQGVDLHCPEGSVTCIVGPNGAGKSTVLKVISGLLRCRSGKVSMAGTRTDGLDPARILALGITQVPQSQALFPGLSVRENVLLGGYLIRRNRKLLTARYASVRERIPLVAERSSTPAGNLSGGQRRLVEIARCLMLDPRLLLLDEPSLGLDPRSLATVATLIRTLHAAGTTILLVEQNVRLGLGLATHGVVMEGGRVRLTGTATEVRDNPEMAALYLGGSTTPPPTGAAAAFPPASPASPASAASSAADPLSPPWPHASPAAPPAAAEPATPTPLTAGSSTPEPATARPSPPELTAARPSPPEPAAARPSPPGSATAPPSSPKPATTPPLTAPPQTSRPSSAEAATAPPLTAPPHTSRPSAAEAAPAPADPPAPSPATQGVIDG